MVTSRTTSPWVPCGSCDRSGRGLGEYVVRAIWISPEPHESLPELVLGSWAGGAFESAEDWRSGVSLGRGGAIKDLSTDCTSGSAASGFFNCRAESAGFSCGFLLIRGTG